MTTTNAAKAAEYSANLTTHPENTHQDSSTQESSTHYSNAHDSNTTITQKFESLNPQTQKLAEEAAKGFKGFLKNTFIQILKQGQSLNSLEAQMKKDLGKQEGAIVFKTW